MQLFRLVENDELIQFAVGPQHRLTLLNVTEIVFQSEQRSNQSVVYLKR